MYVEMGVEVGGHDPESSRVCLYYTTVLSTPPLDPLLTPYKLLLIQSSIEILGSTENPFFFFKVSTFNIMLFIPSLIMKYLN